MATPDQACHFRHCVRLYSEATDQGLTYLTSEVTGSSPSAVATGRVFAGPATTYCWNQHWWLLTDRPGSNDDPGVGYLCDTFTSDNLSSDTTKFHAVACAAQVGEHPAADHSTPNSYSALEQWEFVADGTALIIRKPGTSLCLTAGSSPSNSIGSPSVQCSLTTYGGYANQRWTLMEPELPANLYQIAPVLDPALAIATPGQISQDKATLGIESYDETDPTATWMGWYRSDGTYGQGISSIRWVRYDAPEQRRVAGMSAPGFQVATKLIQRVSAEPTTPTELFEPICDVAPYPQRQYQDAAFETASGNFFGHQFSEDPSAAFSLSSSDGTLPVAASPWVQTLSTIATQSNAPQFFYTLPRNFHNPGLPTPYDLQLVCRDTLTGDEWTLGSTDEIELTRPITITPKFICDWDAFSVICRVRFRKPSENSWGAWTNVISPTNGNSNSIKQAPWVMPDGPEAWVPNAWAGTVDSAGYRSLTQPIDLGLLLYYHAGQVMQISVTVKAFAYGPSYRYPWAPYTGPGATFTSLISARPTITPSAAYLSDDGLHISYGSTQFPGSGQCHLMMTSLRVDDDELLLSPYDAPIYSAIGDIVVPMAAFDGESAISVVSRFESISSLTLTISGSLASPYASQSFSSSITLTMESGSSVLPSSVTSMTSLGQWATRISAPSASGYTWRSSYQIVTSDDGTTLMPLTSAGSEDRMTRPMVGQSLDASGQPIVAMLFLRDSGNALAFRVISTTRTEPRPVASLSWTDAAGVIHIIPVQGELSFAYSSSKRIEAAQRLGATRFISGSSGGSTPSVKFSGSIFKDELAAIATPADAFLSIETGVSVLYRIPDDVDVLLRTTHGTAHLVRIVKIDTPRNVAGMAQVTIEMLEVEPS